MLCIAYAQSAYDYARLILWIAVEKQYAIICYLNYFLFVLVPLNTRLIGLLYPMLSY